MITIHKKQTGIQVSYQYVDLYSAEGKAEGTKVVVQILKQSYQNKSGLFMP
jgi:hypothetical protein